ALGVAAIVAPYLLWNRLRFGDWLPISARLKSAFPHWDPTASLHTVTHTSLNGADLAAVFLALAAALLWCATWPARRSSAGRGPGLPGALPAMHMWALSLAVRLVWLLLFSRLEVQGSYFVLAPPFLALAAILAARAVAGPVGARVAAVLVMAAAVVLGLAKLA